MIGIRVIALCGASLVALASSRAVTLAAASAAEPKHVTITVQRPDGSPIADVPVFVGAGRFIPLISSANGIAECDIDTDQAFFSVGVNWTAEHQKTYPGVYQRGMLDWQAAWKAQKLNYGNMQYVPVPSANGVSVSIIARPSVTLSGHLVDAAGQPVAALLQARGGSVLPGARAADDTGLFTIHGVAAELEAELFMLLSDGRVLSHSVLPALADQDLGDIVIPAWPTTSSGQLLVQVQRGAQPAISVVPANGITLVNHDASAMYSAAVIGQEGYVYKSHAEQVPLQLPAGTYTLIPGVFLAMDWQTAIIDAIRDGNSAITQSLPTVTIVEGELREITVSTSDVAVALEQVMPSGS